MPRLFVAIELPPPQRESLARLMHGVNDARWVNTERMHLTLRFIGNTTQEQLAQIKSALERVEFAPFEAKPVGVGSFSAANGRGPARVLWTGIQPLSELVKLHAAIEAALESAACAPESNRDFQPHITLARFKRPPNRDVDRWLQKNKDYIGPPWMIESFTLYSSDLTPQEAVHTPLLTRQAHRPT